MSCLAFIFLLFVGVIGLGLLWTLGHVFSLGIVEKVCPFCRSRIPIKATCCPKCTKEQP